MSTARNGALRIVAADSHTAAPADFAQAQPDDSDWRAETVVHQWEPENQLTGALMWMPAAQVRPILELVPDNAIWRPLTRWVYELIRAVVDEGGDPDPVTVLARGKHQPASDTLHHQQPTAARHHRLAVYMFDLYTHTITPAAAPSYARDVLDDAYRRAFREHGIRMHQLGECDADRADLDDQFGRICAELADLRRRAETAATPGWERP